MLAMATELRCCHSTPKFCTPNTHGVMLTLTLYPGHDGVNCKTGDDKQNEESHISEEDGQNRGHCS